ncbi:transposable element Tcb2 transposase [Trichonephila clavipes]|uniref:Transposable element Tcb2 transposase n=1 Tax=Trichonephila clavipes TaxID=2585209 RepID=A0A8X6T137_TRICX|nr:transposable element Tcb2 transposase [Trichonephila clavipes]
MLEAETIQSMEWPACSPDLNPIEHVWDMIGRRIAARPRPPATVRDLEIALLEEWNSIPQSLIDKPHRIHGIQINNRPGIRRSVVILAAMMWFPFVCVALSLITAVKAREDPYTICPEPDSILPCIDNKLNSLPSDLSYALPELQSSYVGNNLITSLAEAPIGKFLDLRYFLI